MSDALLEVHHLTKYFPLNHDVISRLTGKTRTLKAVDDISLSIQPGETLGLVGESGCGKSTTARLITRLIEPSSGTMVLKGEDLLALPASRMLEMRKTVQLVFQDPYSSLNPRKTVMQILSRPLEVHHLVHGWAAGRPRRSATVAAGILSPVTTYKTGRKRGGPGGEGRLPVPSQWERVKGWCQGWRGAAQALRGVVTRHLLVPAAKVLVPLDTARALGLRRPLQARHVRRMLRRLQHAASRLPKRGQSASHYAWCKACIRQSGALGLAEVRRFLHDLESQERFIDLHLRWLRMYVHTQLAAEIAHALHCAPTDAAHMVDAALTSQHPIATLPPPVPEACYTAR